jgi:type IV pilus assembly protein PilB
MSDVNNSQNTAPVTPAATGIVEKSKSYLEQKVSDGSLPAVSSTPHPQSVSVRGISNVADALFAKGIISEDTLKSVKFEAITTSQPIEKVLLAKNFVSEVQIQQVKAEMYAMGFIDLQSITIPAETLNRIPKDSATKNMAVLFEETAARAKVAMLDPLDLQKVQFIQSILNKKVDTYFATEAALKNVMDTKYGAQIGNVVDRALADIGVVDINQAGTGGELSQGEIEGAPVAKIVNMILDYAIKHSASDIHIEPREGRLAVRFRIHGVLAEKLSLPLKLANSIVARIKILSNMKIDEHRVPQDNRFQVKTEGKGLDIRVSIMPSIYGEKVVMRLLEKNQQLVDINNVGIRGAALKIYKEALNRTQGIILITGPTGSGKTVTLASSLGILNTQEVNILTLEDPVEIRIDGITQVQVNSEVGLSFAAGLRSFLRQDPDIIMVGEIRDSETANLAVQAALTGHLVLATLHTNSAAGAITRLMDIGVAPYLLASTINVVVGQRLVRKLDPDSREAYEASPEVIKLLHKELDGLNGFDLYSKHGENQEQLHFDAQTQKVSLYRPVPTPSSEDGFSGRIGIFEVMNMSDKISKMVMENASARDIHLQAVSEGMVSMAQDGFMKALEGITTIEEVMRVQTT